MSEVADVLVIGLGAMGAAAAYQLAKRGVSVIGIDRFAPPHNRGSSHGATRITRQAIGEGAAYVPLALRSHEIWRELESETGEHLLLQCGFLTIDDTAGKAIMHGKPCFVQRTAEMAQQFGIAHEQLSPAEAMNRFPAFALRGSEDIYYEPGGGLVYAERCIAAQLARASELGARLRVNEPVLSLHSQGDHVSIRTGVGEYWASQVVVAAGGWTPGLVGQPLSRLQLLRQTLHWFEPTEAHLYSTERFPTFTWAHGLGAEDSFYGFPLVPDSVPGVKLATEQFSEIITSPEAMDRIVTEAENDSFYRTHAQGRLLSLSDRVESSSACFYTNAPDGDFVVDHLVDNERVTIVSACSGHGFKHSAALGAHVSAVLTGNEACIVDFALSRPALSPAQQEVL